MILLHEPAQGRCCRHSRFGLQPAILAVYDFMRFCTIKSDARLVYRLHDAALLRDESAGADRHARLVPIAKRLSLYFLVPHTHDWLHLWVCQPAQADQFVAHLFLFECKLCNII